MTLVVLAAAIAIIAVELKFAVGMVREVSLYAAGALRDRPPATRTVGQVAAAVVGFALWQPLLIFNLVAFRTAWPVTSRRLEPRRF